MLAVPCNMDCRLSEAFTGLYVYRGTNRSTGLLISSAAGALASGSHPLTAGKNNLLITSTSNQIKSRVPEPGGILNFGDAITRREAVQITEQKVRDLAFGRAQLLCGRGISR